MGAVLAREEMQGNREGGLTGFGFAGGRASYSSAQPTTRGRERDQNRAQLDRTL
jgi:hypothetical protein